MQWGAVGLQWGCVGKCGAVGLQRCCSVGQCGLAWGYNVGQCGAEMWGCGAAFELQCGAAIWGSLGLWGCSVGL